MRSTKNIIALLLALVLCLSVAACAKKTEATATAAAEPTALPVAEPTAEPAPEGIAAVLGNYSVTVNKVLVEYENFVYYMNAYGLEMPTDEAELKEYVDMIVDSQIEDIALAWQADSMGLTLTSEQEAQINTAVEEERAALVSSYEQSAREELGESATAEQVTARGMELLENDVLYYVHCNFETYMSDYRNAQIYSAKADLLKEAALKDVTVTEEEVNTWYTAAVETDKAAVEADPFAFRDTQENYEAALSDAPALYAPAGFVRVQVIEVAMDTETAAAYAENNEKMLALQAEYGALALNEGTGTRGVEIRTEHNALLAANAEIEATLKAKADGIHEEALTSNMTFGALSKKYNETLSDTAAENGTFAYVNGEDPRYAAEITAAVAKLADGDISEVIESNGAYYIIRRVSTVAEGAVALENVKAYVEAQALSEKQETVWNEASATYTAAAHAAAVKYPSNYAHIK